MSSKQNSEILEYINKCVRSERGKYLAENDLFMDSELDSLGVTMAILAIDDKYDILGDVVSGWNPIVKLDIPNLTVKRLIELCK